jgi:hypothetical protein
MEVTEQEQSEEPKIVGLKILQQWPTGTSLSFRYSGDFRLSDYEEIDLEVTVARLVRKA